MVKSEPRRWWLTGHRDIPADAADVDLRQWRVLRTEYQDLGRVRAVCEQFALNVIESQASSTV